MAGGGFCPQCGLLVLAICVILVLAAVLAGCGVSPRPAASEALSQSPLTASPVPSASLSPSPKTGFGCGDSLIGGQLWQGDEGSAGIYNSRHRFIRVQWPPGYTVDYGAFRIFNSFTLYDAQGRKVGDGGDTIMVSGDWARSGKLFVACGVGRVIAADPGDPGIAGPFAPVEWCVAWQLVRRAYGPTANPLLVPDTEGCGELRTL